jgi:hypothetical protein
MHVSTSIDTWARRIGLALGLLLALGAVLSWRVAAEGAAVGAEVRFLAVPPGELTMAPSGAFLSARGLRPGGQPARGELRFGNITGTAVAVGLRALPSGRDLDRSLRVELSTGGERLFSGRLGRLRSWTRLFALARGDRRALSARVWVPRSTGARAAGAVVDVTVELRAEPRHG